MNIKTTVMAAALAAMAATSANAATFDFVEMADDFWASNPAADRFEATFEQFQASAFASALTDGGVSVTGAFGSFTGGEAHAFLDSGNAGLGVCHSGFQANGVSECSSNGGSMPGDDNITAGETLTVNFNGTVGLDGLTIRNAGHHLANGTILINGSSYTLSAGELSAADLAAIGTGFTFTFAYGGGGPFTEAYLSDITVSAVPLPAGLVLLVGGLAGLVSLRRRKAAT